MDARDGGQVWPDCLICPQEDQEEPDPERDGHGQPQAQPQVMLGVRGGHHGPSSPHNHSHQIPGDFFKKSSIDFRMVSRRAGNLKTLHDALDILQNLENRAM